MAVAGVVGLLTLYSVLHVGTADAPADPTLRAVVAVVVVVVVVVVCLRLGFESDDVTTDCK